ncbi:MAG: tRNA (adenosine(37)-N6)-threonylcarbamoyltransferase complex ATPase subunit type 1 TsaE [Tissierellia bacterium]|nr:tRNA (adenosine(37)-N6)-threonylcarbamoyltransferase complex ATPase subunit type 1 TsaE [Tissierellia bacterium]
MIISNLDQMRKFANEFSKQLKKGDVVNLIGDLGAGKTTLVKMIAQNFNIDKVVSPTFSIVNIYDGDVKIYHLDLYRLDDEDEILDIDYETYIYPDDEITFIEWSDKAKSYMPLDMINLTINKIDENKREIILD